VGGVTAATGDHLLEYWRRYTKEHPNAQVRGWRPTKTYSPRPAAISCSRSSTAHRSAERAVRGELVLVLVQGAEGVERDHGEP
jgi:hypothetical protein